MISEAADDDDDEEEEEEEEEGEDEDGEDDDEEEEMGTAVLLGPEIAEDPADAAQDYEPAGDEEGTLPLEIVFGNYPQYDFLTVQTSNRRRRE